MSVQKINPDTYVGNTGKQLKDILYNTHSDFRVYNNCYGGSYSTSGDNYLIIRTPIQYDKYTMNRVKIEGYLYRNSKPLNVEIVWYNYLSNNVWSIINCSWYGIGPDEVRLGQHTDTAGNYINIVLHFPNDNYFTRFYVTQTMMSSDNVFNQTIWTSYVKNTLPNFSYGCKVIPRVSYDYDSGYQPMVSFGTYFGEYGGNFRAVRVRKIGNVCYLKGLINVTQARNNTEDVVCVLPNGFRPSLRIYTQAASSAGEVSSGGHPCLLTIRPDGNICLHNSYCTGWLSLDGISYIQD